MADVLDILICLVVSTITKTINHSRFIFAYVCISFKKLLQQNKVIDMIFNAFRDMLKCMFVCLYVLGFTSNRHGIYSFIGGGRTQVPLCAFFQARTGTYV
jgi:hypothetical protein